MVPRLPNRLSQSLFACSCLLALGFVVGCGGAASSLADGAPSDAGVLDAGVADAGADDAGAVDAGAAVDAGFLADGGSANDGGSMADGGTFDAGLPDAGAADAGLADAGLADAGSVDAGAPDAGPGYVDCPAYPGDGDTDDYTDIEGLRDADLRAALLARVEGHHALAYDAAKAAMFGDGGFDVRDGGVECVYSARVFAPSLLDRSGGYNVEHSWPQSQGANDPPAHDDMHHLFPAEKGWNSSRGNIPYGDTNCDVSACSRREAGSEIGPRIGGTERIMEVRPERSGDIARAHFYFSVRYALPIPPAEEASLRRWNRCDPPDDEERARNDAIEAPQQNRNPFIDRPEFVDYISDY